MNRSIATLRRLAVVLGAGELGQDGAWLGEGLQRYLDCASAGLTLAAALGLEPSWWLAERRARRDAALREFAERFLPEEPSRKAMATRLRSELRRYESGNWLRDRRAAAFLHAFLLPHALAFYAGVLGLSNDHDRLTSLAGHILAHKLEKLTNRDVQRGDKAMRGLERRDLDRIFEQLDAFGWITRTAPPRPADPPHWVVNPVVHQKFAARAKSEEVRRKRERDMIAGIMPRARSGKSWASVDSVP